MTVAPPEGVDTPDGRLEYDAVSDQWTLRPKDRPRARLPVTVATALALLGGAAPSLASAASASYSSVPDK